MKGAIVSAGVLCLISVSTPSPQLSLPPLVFVATMSLAYPQSSFSPFSLLGSFFGSGPVPARPRQRPPPSRQRPRQRPQPGPRIILRPNLVVGPSISTPNFSASQPVPQRIKLEENPTSRPTKSSRSHPSKSSRGVAELSSTSGLVTISTLPEVKVTSNIFSSFNKTQEVTSRPEVVETTEQVTEQPVTVIIKNEIITSVTNEAEERIRRPSQPTRQTFLNDQGDNKLVSGPNVDTTFSVSLENINRDNYYDELLAPKPLNTYYTPQNFHYNQDPFILEDTISVNDIDGIKSGSLQDVKFQIYPRGNVGSHRNQPVIISQIPVKSLQTSTKLIKNPMPPAPQNSFSTLPTHPTSPIFSLPISQHNSKNIHSILSKHKEKHHQSLVTPFVEVPTFSPFIYETTTKPIIDETTAKQSNEDIILTKKIKRQPVFEVLPTPQQQQKFDFPRITEKSGRKVDYKSSDYADIPNTIEESFRGNIIGERKSNKSKNSSKLAEIRSKNLAQLVDCGAGSDVGFCAMAASYPESTVQDLIKNCQIILKAFLAVVPEDLTELGDNSPVVGPDGEQDRNHQDNSKPWSWKAYSYKKRQICDSELYFIKPGFARDTKGTWQLIIQTDNIQQRVAIDMCHSPGSPCPGVADCGTKSTCVQRYNYQLLLAMNIQDDIPKDEEHACPTIRAFKFPTSCVCHVETYHNPHGKHQLNLFFNKLT